MLKLLTIFALQVCLLVVDGDIGPNYCKTDGECTWNSFEDVSPCEDENPTYKCLDGMCYCKPFPVWTYPCSTVDDCLLNELLDKDDPDYPLICKDNRCNYLFGKLTCHSLYN